MSGTDPGDPVAVASSFQIEDLNRWFGPAVFPATITELLGEAWAALAPESISSLLASLDGDERVESLTALQGLLATATPLVATQPAP
jgi:hypothetical protein